MKFKIGQTVELVDNSGMAAKVGATALVYGIERGLINISWKTKRNGQCDGGYFPQQFKPISMRGQQLLFSFME